MKYRDIIKLLEADGWYWVSTKGNHQKYRHPRKKGTIPVPAHGLGSDTKIGLEEAILKQAGLSYMANYTAIFEEAEDGTWSTEAASTRCRKMRAPGWSSGCEGCKDQGLPIPEPTTRVRAFEVAA